MIPSHARQSYDQQVSTLETYRSKAGALLAFAAVLFLVLSSAKGFREVPSTHSLEIWEIDAWPEQSKVRLLRHTLVAIRSNRRALRLIGAVLSIGLAWLLAGTILIGMRLAVLLL